MQVLALLQCSSIAMEDCYVFHCSNVGIVFVSSLSVDLIYVLQKLDKKNIVPFLASLWYSFIKLYFSLFFVQVEVAVFGVVFPL